MFAPFNTPQQLNGLHEYIGSDKVNLIQTIEIWFDQDTVSRLHESEKIIILFLVEYNCYQWIEPLLCKSKLEHQQTGKLKNYYIFVSLHKYGSSLFNEYNEYFTQITDYSLYAYYTSRFPDYEFINTEKKLHFLSLNNRASVNRQSLYYLFEKFSLRPKSYFSYRGSLKWSTFKSIKEISDVIVGNNAPWYAKNLDLDRLHNQIPVTIEHDQWEGNDWSTGNDRYYQDTFCSIVTETYPAEQYPMFTEKTFKPIVFFHPFILDCPAGGLQLLKDMGFKTFSNWWDEDYDNYHGEKRLESIFHLILEISNWSTDKINQVYNEMLPVLMHNQKHFIESLPKIFEDRKPKLFEEIKNIVVEKEKLL